MANGEHVDIVRQGKAAVDQWWHLHTPTSGVLDLRGADLRGADLSLLNLAGANLFNAKLQGANLIGTKLFAALLAVAKLEGALLVRADLTMANLFVTDLTRANLFGAVFSGAHIEGTMFGHAEMGQTVLVGVNLGKVSGLATVKHTSPSGIGTETLYWTFRRLLNPPAHEKLDDFVTFCLGAGVPKGLLDAIPAIVTEAVYHSCFVSYGESDRQFAEKLVGDLRLRGVSCWLYSNDATPGRRTWSEIGQSRRDADKFVVLCSADALVRDGVLKEVEEQIDEDLDKLVPVSVDDLWRHPGFRVMRGARDLKHFLLDRNYADFKNHHDEEAYQEALKHLLRGLRRSDASESARRADQ